MEWEDDGHFHMSNVNSINTSVIVTRNGSPVNAVSGSYSLTSGDVFPKWDITLAEPLDVSESDLWSMFLVVEGQTFSRFSNCNATSLGGEDGLGKASRQVSCSMGSSGDALLKALYEYCIPKTLVFINQDWINLFASTARLVDGILRWINPINYLGQDTGKPRLFHPRLPGPEVQDSDFECIIGPRTHHDIARYLAGLVGVSLFVNTPNLDLQDTMTISAGTKWIDAITGIFSVWGPEVRTIPSLAGNPPRIIVSDILSPLDGAADIVDCQILEIDNPAVVSVSFTTDGAGIGSSSGNNQIVDAVVVTGRKTKNTTIQILKSEETEGTEPTDDEEVPPDYSTRISSIVPRSVDAVFVTSSSDQYVKDKDEKGRQINDLGFGVPPFDYKLKNVRETITYMYCSRSEDLSSGKVTWTPIKTDTVVYGGTGTILSVHRQKNYYGADGRVLVTSEEEYMRCHFPGEKDDQLRLLRKKETDQSRIILPLKVSQTYEEVLEYVLYDEVKKDGEKYRDNPRPLADVIRGDTSRQAIDKSEKTSQRVMWLKTSSRTTTIDRMSENVLMKTDVQHNYLTASTKRQSQILDNPLSKIVPGDPGNPGEPGQQKAKTTKQEVQFQKSFFDGPGRMIGQYGPCYHPPVKVGHDDIVTDEQAWEIARRIFARGKTIFIAGQSEKFRNRRLTVVTPVPIPLDTTSVKVRLGNYVQRVNGSLTNVPGGDFYLKSLHEEWGFGGSGRTPSFSYKQTLSLKTTY
jgi:hypothetical protein